MVVMVTATRPGTVVVMAPGTARPAAKARTTAMHAWATAPATMHAWTASAATTHTWATASAAHLIDQPLRRGRGGRLR